MVTPLEAKAFGELTGHTELVDFVTRLSERSSRMSLHSLGESVEGRDIPYLKVSAGEFGADREAKLLVLIFAQQHGNEPSGKEAALVLARDFASVRHDDLLAFMDVLLVPQVNPDGGEVHRRRNADNVDLNRSHLILDGREVTYLRELYHRWEPEVTVDVHEYQPWSNAWVRHGYIRLFDEQYGLPTNLNVPAPVRELAEEAFLPYARDYLAERGYTFHNYTVGNPGSIRYSTSNINDGRQGFAILNSFGLILEGRNGRTPTENIERRTAAQVAALEALLHFAADYREELNKRVRTAVEDLRSGRVGKFVLTMARESDGNPLRMEAMSVTSAPEDHEFDHVETGIVDVEIDNYYPLVVGTRTIPLPKAYLVPAEEAEIIDLLRRHRVEFEKMEAGEAFSAEVFTIDGFVEEEFESTTRIPLVSSRRMTYETSAGDVVVPTIQRRGLLVATALEPQSMHGLIQYDAFEHLKTVGTFPVMRIHRREN